MKTSKGEQIVADLLTKNEIPFKTQVMFKGLYGKKHIHLRYDFAIVKNNKVFFLIEIDGRQHYTFVKHFHKSYSGYLKAQERDRIKNKFALLNNIPLIRIPYWDLETLTFDKIFNNQNYRVKSKFHLDYLRQEVLKNE